MKRILVGLDTTPESAFVLSSAVELARSMGGKIRLVRAVAPPSGSVPPTAIAWSQVLDSTIADADADLMARMSAVPEAMRDGTVVQVGNPADVLCTLARTYEADMVVLGAHRHGIFARALGTTAARVVDHIDRPVVVVRPVPPPAARANDESNAIKVRAGALLRREHARLEQLYDDFLGAYRSGEWARVREGWATLESALREHIKIEQREVLPSFRAIQPAEAAGLASDHETMLRLTDAIAMAIELHAFPAADARELIARIRAHTAREEVLLYPWMDEALDVRSMHLLGAA